NEAGSEREHDHHKVRRPVRVEPPGPECSRDELRRARADRAERERQTPERLAQREYACAVVLGGVVREEGVERDDRQRARGAVRKADAAESTRRDEPGHIGRGREDEVARDRQERAGDKKSATAEAV